MCGCNSPAQRDRVVAFDGHGLAGAAEAVSNRPHIDRGEHRHGDSNGLMGGYRIGEEGRLMRPALVGHGEANRGGTGGVDRDGEHACGGRGQRGAALSTASREQQQEQKGDRTHDISMR